MDGEAVNFQSNLPVHLTVTIQIEDRCYLRKIHLCHGFVDEHRIVNHKIVYLFDDAFAPISLNSE
jgi:hypothetical protein